MCFDCRDDEPIDDDREASQEEWEAAELLWQGYRLAEPVASHPADALDLAEARS